MQTRDLGGSAAGEWLDHMVDAAKISSLHLAVLISLYRFDHVAQPMWLLVPIGFTVISNVTFFAMLLNDSLRRVSAATGGARPGPAPNTMRSLLVIPTDYGVLCLSFLLLGSVPVFLGVYGSLFAAGAGFLALASVKWFRDMGRLDDAT